MFVRSKTKSTHYSSLSVLFLPLVYMYSFFRIRDTPHVRTFLRCSCLDWFFRADIFLFRLFGAERMFSKKSQVLCSFLACVVCGGRYTSLG